MKIHNFLILTFISVISFETISEEYNEAISNKDLACYDNFIPGLNTNGGMSISPDGRYLLIRNTVKNNICDIEPDKVKKIEDETRDLGLLLVDLDTMETTMLSDGSESKGIRAAGWLSSTRIWFTPRYKVNQDRDSLVMFAMNIDGTRRTTIMEPGYYQGIYDKDYDDPNHVYVMTNERRSAILDYYKMNIYTGKKTRIALGPDISDMKGKAMLGDLMDPETKMPMMMLIDDGIDRIIYEYDQSKKEWSEHFKFKCQEPGYYPLGLHKGKVVVSGSKFSPSGKILEDNDTNAIYLYDMKTREFSDKLYQDDVYDVGGLTGSCRTTGGYAASVQGNSSVQYIRYTSYQPEYLFFDKDAEATYIALKNIFPDEFVSVLSSDVSAKVMLVKVSSPSNPGQIYIVDLHNDTINILAEIAPWLDRSKLAKTIPVTYTARDGLEIPAYLTLATKKTDKNYFVILPHGGPNVKQSIGFDKWVQFFAKEGINVLQPDYRGSTGYGFNHYKAGNLQWGKKMQDDLTDGVLWAIENGYADKDRVCIAGASYGGYATMAGLVFTPELYRCGINSVGVTDQEQLLQNFARNASRFQSWDKEPLLEWGDMSTPEGKEYAKEISPILHVKNIQAPVLVLHGSNDYIVPVNHARDLISELRSLGKEYDSMFQAYDGHCVVSCGEQANLEYLDKQKEFLDKYMFN